MMEDVAKKHSVRENTPTLLSSIPFLLPFSICVCYDKSDGFPSPISLASSCVSCRQHLFSSSTFTYYLSSYYYESFLVCVQTNSPWYVLCILLFLLICVV